jgi:hypothetical protein
MEGDRGMTLSRRGLVLLQILVLGCVLSDDHHGDGELSDQGPTTATSRYILDLGPVGAGTRVYRLEGLPSVEFTVGLQVDDLKLEEAEAVLRENGAHIGLTLTTAEGEAVFDQAGQLAGWVWTSGAHSHSGAFAYRRGEHQEVQRPGGDVEIHRVGIGVDGGWGTYFKPRRDEEYRLEVAASSAGDFFSSHTVSLLAKGGGWK